MKPTLLTLAVLLLTISSCSKKDTPLRATSYIIVPQNGATITGTVSFREITDATQTQVDIQLQNTAWNSKYEAHIHAGPPVYYHIAVYGFTAYAVGNTLSYQKNISMSYDSAIRYDGTFVLHDSLGNAVFGKCGIGKNG